MRHATDTTLDLIEPLLERLRAIAALRERKRGVFYRGSRACVHFHEDPAGIFADVRLDDRWERLPVNGVSNERALVELLAELDEIAPRRAPRG